LFERSTIFDVNPSATAPYQVPALQQLNRKIHSRPAHAEHLPEEFLRQGQGTQRGLYRVQANRSHCSALADLERSIAFYERHFGFKNYAQQTVTGGPRIAYLKLGDTVLELTHRSEGAMIGFHFYRKRAARGELAPGRLPWS
jgi:hypothetical protein